MRFHVFYFTPHPKRELRDNTEMREDTGKSQICLAANVQGTGSLTA